MSLNIGQYFKKLTFRRAFHDLGSLASLVGGLLAAHGLVTPEQGVAIVGIGKGLGSLTGEKTSGEVKP